MRNRSTDTMLSQMAVNYETATCPTDRQDKVDRGVMIEMKKLKNEMSFYQRN